MWNACQPKIDTKIVADNTMYYLDSMTKKIIMMRLKRQTTSERYGVCEKCLTHFHSTHIVLYFDGDEQQVSLFSFSLSLSALFLVRHTQIKRNAWKKQKKNRTKTRIAREEKKNHFHIPLRTDKNICRLMIILPKFIGQNIVRCVRSPPF